MLGRCVRDDNAGRYADERVNDIPDTIEIRNFVGEEFDEIEKSRDTDDPPVIQNIESATRLSIIVLSPRASDSWLAESLRS